MTSPPQVAAPLAGGSLDPKRRHRDIADQLKREHIVAHNH